MGGLNGNVDGSRWQLTPRSTMVRAARTIRLGELDGAANDDHRSASPALSWWLQDDATINNVNGSDAHLSGSHARQGMIAGNEATINNDADSVINFNGLNVFGFAGANGGTAFNNYGTVKIDGVTQLGTIDQ
jgi:hypothetical protein